jgi:hypothetical protein
MCVIAHLPFRYFKQYVAGIESIHNTLHTVESLYDLYDTTA